MKKRNIHSTGIKWLVLASVFLFVVVGVYFLQQNNGKSFFSVNKKETEDAVNTETNSAAIEEIKKDPAKTEDFLTKRKERILSTIKKDPSILKKEKLSDDFVASLPEDLLRLVEKDVKKTGKLTVYMADNKDLGQEKYFRFESGKEKYNLYFIEGQEKISSSSEVSLEGVALDNELVVASGNDITVKSSPKPLTGAQDPIVIRFNFQNDTSTPWTASDIADEIFLDPDSSDEYFKEVSYNQVSFPGDANLVTNWYTVPYNSGVGCDYNIGGELDDWTTSAMTQATNDGWVLGNYNRYIFIFPDNSSCDWAGLGEVGGTPTMMWSNGSNDDRLFSHELGHNVGVGHASYRDCGTKAINTYSSCTTSEYGDIYDVMGYWNRYHFNAAFKQISGWIPAGEITTVASSGTYTLNVLEDGASAKKALKIQKPNTSEYYWLEYRKATGFDSTLGTGVTRGVIVHTYNGVAGDNTYLLDMTPQNGWTDIALSNGASFEDTANDIYVQQISSDATSVEVSVILGSYQNISLNTFRIAMEDATTPDPNDYVLASNPAIGEPVSVRATLKNSNAANVTITDVRLMGVLDSGTQFVVGTTASLEIPANGSKLVPVASFGITSFRIHSFYIDYKLNGVKRYPYVKPTYSYQKIKAHFPNVKVVKTPVFIPSSIASGNKVYGVYKLKNYDTRPAYMRSVMIVSKVSGNTYHFTSYAPKINPSSVYQYYRYLIPAKKGTYASYARITYGNGSTIVPYHLSSTSPYGSFRVY